MTSNLTDAQVDRWRLVHDEMMADANWIVQNKELDERRLVIQSEMLNLLNRFLAQQIQIEEVRATFDAKTRTSWNAFGLKGMSGAMFLNMLVKNIPDSQALTEELRSVLNAPNDTDNGRWKMRKFFDFLRNTVESGQVQKRLIQPARTPFFVSSWWHLQNTEVWPIFYISARRVLEQDGLYSPTSDPVDD
ncbi:MAG: hypothetical protein IH955_07135, partial [Chloroflexi bacterium]|nr:hypothetical protein [Chloroflexota bacterium]